MKGLIYFSCENIYSFKEKIEFTMENSKGEKELVSAIYGANASGKTNFIKALDFFKFLIVTSKELSVGDKIRLFPFKGNENKDTEFKIIFKNNSIKYAYYLKINESRIVEENLYHYPSGKISKIFTRNYNQENESYIFDYGRSYIKELKGIELVCPSNKIFLSVAASWKEIDEIKNPFMFFSNVIQSNMGLNEMGWFEKSAEILQRHNQDRNKFIDLVKVILPGLKNIESNIERKQVSLEYENGMVLDLAEESKGIKRIIEILGPILEILKNGQVLLFDEIESSFHPIIAKYIINLFLDKTQNKNEAQLIFTTHDVNLLDGDTLKKDLIWFTERCKENGYSTDLYPLSIIEGVRTGENIRKNYLKGKYSWIPLMDEFNMNKFILKENEECDK